MNNEASKKYKEADLELNRVCQEVLVEYKLDSIFIDRLKKTQRIWILYRDAELAMKFPAKD